jgi:hypothetical protein
MLAYDSKSPLGPLTALPQAQIIYMLCRKRINVRHMNLI